MQAVDGKAVAVKPHPNQSGEGGHQNGEHGGGYPATRAEAAVVGDAEGNGRGYQGVENGRESSMDRAGVVIPHVTEGVTSELFAEDDGRVHVAYCLRGEGMVCYTSERQMEGGKSPEEYTVDGDGGRAGKDEWR